jgi:hypothetical protein
MISMRSILGLGTLLVLLTPGVGGAREAWGHARLSLLPETPAAGTSSWDLSRDLRSTDDGREVSTKERPSMAARVAVETLMAGLLGVSGVFVGGLGGIVVAMATDDHSCMGDTCGLKALDRLVWGMGVGVALTAPLGAYLAGHMMGGEGLLLPTLASSLVFEALTIVAIAVTDSYDSRRAALLVITPLVGSVIGYEVSHFFVSRDRERAATSGVQVLPTAGVTRSGTGVFGLAGRF